VIAGLGILAACTVDDSSIDETAEPSWVVIASPYAWAETPLADDPFAQLRPEDATCDATGHGPDDFGGEPSYEVDTGLCNYLSISQAALQALPAGTPVAFRVWHFDLEADLDSPAQAYLALDIDGRVVYEHTVSIPATSELITGEFELQADVPLGARLTVHLHNHGANTWNVLSLEALVASH
jgi:hypothetical protein